MKYFQNSFRVILVVTVLGLLVFINCSVKKTSNILTKNEQPEVEVGELISINSQFKDLPIVEPHISAHPANNDHLLAAAMIVTDINKPYQSSRLSSFVSKDGGLSWTETVHDYWGYDPWTGILSNGQTAMTWLGTPGQFKHQFPIQFFSSDDGGINWSEQIQEVPSGHGHDGTKITGMAESFYFTTVRFNDDMSADVILYQRRNDGPFKEVAKISGQGIRLNFCEPAILSDGTVVVPASHFLQKVWVQLFNPLTNSLSDKHIITLKPGGARGYMRLAADVNQGSRFKDRIYFIRALSSRQQQDGGVWLNYSSDKGKTWTNDIRIDQFDNQLPSKSRLASIAINKSGVLGISWIDSQLDSNQLSNDLYFTFSSDGGQTFQKPIRITKVSSNPKTNKNADVANKFPGGGHYMGIAAKMDGSFQLIWSDSQSGMFKLKTCNVKLR